jgi:uncharacterized protein YecT (DUF1311 family)
MKLSLQPAGILLLLVISAPIAAWGQSTTQPPHPIDAAYEECMSIDTNQTTYGMMMCAQQAEEAWDKELNKNYKELMALLTPEEQNQLKEAQRKWLAFRDAEFQFSGNLHYNMEGTMYRPMAADKEMQIVRARALELRGYIDLKTME